MKQSFLTTFMIVNFGNTAVHIQNVHLKKYCPFTLLLYFELLTIIQFKRKLLINSGIVRVVSSLMAIWKKYFSLSCQNIKVVLNTSAF